MDNTNKPTPATDRILTTAQASALTGIPAATLRFWRHQGRGPASFNLGRSVRYRESTLTAWLLDAETRTTRGGTPA